MNDLSILVVMIGIIPACRYVFIHKQVIDFDRYFRWWVYSFEVFEQQNEKLSVFVDIIIYSLDMHLDAREG